MLIRVNDTSHYRCNSNWYLLERIIRCLFIKMFRTHTNTISTINMSAIDYVSFTHYPNKIIENIVLCILHISNWVSSSSSLLHKKFCIYYILYICTLYIHTTNHIPPAIFQIMCTKDVEFICIDVLVQYGRHFVFDNFEIDKFRPKAIFTSNIFNLQNMKKVMVLIWKRPFSRMLISISYQCIYLQWKSHQKITQNIE